MIAITSRAAVFSHKVWESLGIGLRETVQGDGRQAPFDPAIARLS